MHYPITVRLPLDAYEDRDAVFHVVMNSVVGESPFKNQDIGNLVWDVIAREQERNDVRIAAACLMPNHLHVILSPERKSIIRWVNDFKSFTTHLSKEPRGRRVLWRRGFYGRRLREPGAGR